MIKLLKKELKLTASPVTYFFLAFVLMAFIPNYPIALVGFFICYGLFHSFQFGREFNDITYTLMLPVKKSDIVKSKFAFTILVELIAFILSLIIVVVNVFVLSNAQIFSSELTNPNFAFLGYVLIIYAIFNLVFLKGYFKTGVKIGVPFTIFAIIATLLVGISVALPFFPNLAMINCATFDIYQLIPLGVGLVLYVTLTFISFKLSVRAFDKVDL